MNTDDNRNLIEKRRPITSKEEKSVKEPKPLAGVTRPPTKPKPKTK